MTRQKNRLNASFSSEAKKAGNKCFQKHSFNLGEALNRDRTSSKWPWSKVVWSASNICYLHSTWYFWWVPFWYLFFFFFFLLLWEASIFSCSSLNIQFHSDIIVVQLHSVCTYIWIVLKSKVISSGKNHIDLCHSIFEIIFPIRNFSLHKVLALRYISNMLFSDAFSGWAGWALAQLEFGSSVNPIPIRGQIIPTTLLLTYSD